MEEKDTSRGRVPVSSGASSRKDSAPVSPLVLMAAVLLGSALQFLKFSIMGSDSTFQGRQENLTVAAAGGKVRSRI